MIEEIYIIGAIQGQEYYCSATTPYLDFSYEYIDNIVYYNEEM